MTLSALNSFDHLILSHEELSIGCDYTVNIGDSVSISFTLSDTNTYINESGITTEISSEESSGGGSVGQTRW